MDKNFPCKKRIAWNKGEKETRILTFIDYYDDRPDR